MTSDVMCVCRRRGYHVTSAGSTYTARAGAVTGGNQGNEEIVALHERSTTSISSTLRLRNGRVRMAEIGARIRSSRMHRRMWPSGRDRRMGSLSQKGYRHYSAVSDRILS
jgi:hypothetical protein